MPIGAAGLPAGVPIGDQATVNAVAAQAVADAARAAGIDPAQAAAHAQAAQAQAAAQAQGAAMAQAGQVQAGQGQQNVQGQNAQAQGAQQQAAGFVGAAGSALAAAAQAGGSGAGAGNSGQHGRHAGSGIGSTSNGVEPADSAGGAGSTESAWASTLATARTDATAPVAAPQPTAGGTGGPPPLPPAAQIAMRLAILRTAPDGTHQMTIHLNPDELGPISVVAQVRGDELAVHLTGASDAGTEALRAALPELERELRDGGFSQLALNVGQDGAQQQDRSGRPAWSLDNGGTGNGNPREGTGGRSDGAGDGQRPDRHQNRGPSTAGRGSRSDTALDLQL
ncbi:hypothetical protein Val02_55490 [Virgisporangium aliadipatigenens]|uniref:Flagellar hook-length control protein-like C-terminal domain-containing protein n=1 Tax=Virgisporangium aliadipatigenens TaxID=741659 RepID=A0A8J3YQV3_9ACTN|nr:flagellar hook-length control protein FliK [Virgisporangium aliadipatigenens]GIJ48663.1 hypothetical protein Val02_55490 [Virgisporangium aliadipatigenens]